MFDLPLPLGPTITAIPSWNCSSTLPGNDLNPRILMLFRYKFSVGNPVDICQSLAGCGLLGGLLARPRAPSEFEFPHQRHRGEQPLVRRTRSVGHGIRYRCPPTCQLLLQHGLVVDVPLQHVVDPFGEGSDHGFGGAIEPAWMKPAPITASTVAATTLCDRISASISSAPTRSPSSARSRSRPSLRATTAQLVRDTTWARTLARSPSGRSGSARTDAGRWPAPTRYRPGTRAARTTSGAAPPTTSE